MSSAAVSEELDMLKLPEILKLALNSGGSGHGMTYWSDAARCGKRALLYEEQRQGWIADPLTQPIRNVNKKSAFAVGGVYHKLHELWRKDRINGMLFDYNEPIEDVSVELGIRLFKGWRAVWSRDFWGRTVACEVILPASEAARETIVSLFGEIVNAQPDLVVEITEADLERVQTRCPDVQVPGYYLIDFKTAGGKYDPRYYTDGLQALWYPLAWEIEHPDMPLQGMIFDLVYKPRSNAKNQCITEDSFSAVFAPTYLNRVESLAGLIAQGRDNIRRAIELDKGNRAECVKFGFPDGIDLCPFYGYQCHGA